MAPSRGRKSHTPLFSQWPKRCLIDLYGVVFANMHTLAGSFSKPLFSFFPPFFFPLSKACGGCFSLGTDSEVMYGKSYLNICFRLENTLVLEHYPRRLSEKKGACRPGSGDCYSKLQKGWKSGPWGRQAMTLQSFWRFLKITVSTSNTRDQTLLNCGFGSRERSLAFLWLVPSWQSSGVFSH